MYSGLVEDGDAESFTERPGEYKGQQGKRSPAPSVLELTGYPVA